MSNEFSTPKLTPADNVKIPAVDGSNDSGYLLGGEVAQYIGSPLSGETDEYSTLENYSVGDTVIYENSLYKCTGATSGVWDSTKWKQITLKQLMSDVDTNTADIATNTASISSLSTNKLNKSLEPAMGSWANGNKGSLDFTGSTGQSFASCIRFTTQNGGHIVLGAVDSRLYVAKYDRYGNFVSSEALTTTFTD